MAVKVKIPTPLRGLTNDQDTVNADSGSNGQLVIDDVKYAK